MPQDLLIENLAEVATPLGSSPRVGRHQGQIHRIAQGEILCREGRLLFVGSRDERLRRFGEIPEAQRLDASGLTAIPGLVDCHTHLPWAGSREAEFARRLEGATYEEIAAAGGGILSTVSATREASEDELMQNTLLRLDRMLARGSTTVEAKSGYGLSLEAELKQLRALRRAAEQHPARVVPTLMAAHEFPPEHRDDRDRWVQIICQEITPAVAEAGLAEFCDVFCEQGVFTVDQARDVLQAGTEVGLTPRLHADEFVDSGGAFLAAEIGAATADHLVAVSNRGIEAMAKKGVAAVMLPGVAFFLRKEELAPARRFIAGGAPVVLASDCNPGSSHTESLWMIFWLGIFRMQLSVAEALTAVTLNPACALGRGEEVGSLEEGKHADIVLVDAANVDQLAYHFGVNPVHTVIAGGEVVHRRGAERRP
ncbi:MAG: imidazolonepropionase [Acidobacteriota bacterium]